MSTVLYSPERQPNSAKDELSILFFRVNPLRKGGINYAIHRIIRINKMKIPIQCTLQPHRNLEKVFKRTFSRNMG